MNRTPEYVRMATPQGVELLTAEPQPSIDEDKLAQLRTALASLGRLSGFSRGGGTAATLVADGLEGTPPDDPTVAKDEDA